MTLLDIPVTLADGRKTTLSEFSGKVLLVVNVASKCGLTKQYEALEQLYEARRNDGLVILGFPANNFKDQEPGTDEEIVAFCTGTYDVQFPIFSKISVVGADKHPLYAALTECAPQTADDGPFRERLKGFGIEPNPPGEVLWNFEKFLIGRDGRIAGRFAPDTTPDAPALTAAIATELNRAA